MSQVIVEIDELVDKRQATRRQEMAISREAFFDRWRLKSDVTKPNPLMKVAGLALLPLALFWSLIVAGIGVAVVIACFIFNLGMRLVGRH